MKLQAATAALALSMGVFALGCGGDKEEAAKEPAKVETSAPTGDRMAIAKGTVKFKKICAACHGVDAKGMPNLGRDLTISEFVKSNNDDELLAFIIEGREPEGEFAAMPPRGGDATLTDADLKNVIAFIRSIEQ